VRVPFDEVPGSVWLRAHGDPDVIGFDAEMQPMGAGSPHKWDASGRCVSLLVRAVTADDRGQP
jgi:hypothetical protein